MASSNADGFSLDLAGMSSKPHALWYSSSVYVSSNLWRRFVYGVAWSGDSISSVTRSATSTGRAATVCEYFVNSVVTPLVENSASALANHNAAFSGQNSGNLTWAGIVAMDSLLSSDSAFIHSAMCVSMSRSSLRIH